MNTRFRILTLLMAIGVAITGLLSCSHESAHQGAMPWHTGDATVDSLLDCVDRLEAYELYKDRDVQQLLRRIDSIGSRSGIPTVSAAGSLARSRLYESIGADADTHALDSATLSRSAGSLSPYLRARIRLHMAQHEPDLERKTDALFGILPDFIDARDSMRIVETLYELNMAYGRVWDAPTQVEYLREILRYVPDSLSALKGIMQSNIVRLERNRNDSVVYLASLDSLRNEKHLMALAPSLGVMVYSDLYRLRGEAADLDSAETYMRALTLEHDSKRVFMLQKLARAVRAGQPDSAAIYAVPLSERITDDDNAIDIESMAGLIPYYEMIGDTEAADSMRQRLSSARKSADAYERTLRMARMNADRRIGEFREYSERSGARNRMRVIWIVALCTLVPASVLFIWLRRHHRKSDTALKNDLQNAKRRLTVEQMKTAEKERAISTLLQDLEQMAETERDGAPRADDLRRRLRLQLTGDSDWERFAAVFTEMRPGFVENLKHEYPQLTRGDIRLCCLLDMDLDTKHIAQLLMIRPESVKKHRQRLRAKFGLDPGVKWPEFFARF